MSRMRKGRACGGFCADTAGHRLHGGGRTRRSPVSSREKVVRRACRDGQPLVFRRHSCGEHLVPPAPG
jgi:hypothetical protein